LVQGKLAVPKVNRCLKNVFNQNLGWQSCDGFAPKKKCLEQDIDRLLLRKGQSASECYSKSTSFSSDGNRNWGGLIYLDRHNVQCGSNEGMQQWSMKQNSEHTKMKVEYVCCSAVTSHTPKPTED